MGAVRGDAISLKTQLLSIAETAAESKFPRMDSFGGLSQEGSLSMFSEDKLLHASKGKVSSSSRG